MKKTILTFGLALLASAASLSAASVLVNDSNGSTFGNTSGLAIDFDVTTASLAAWSPTLVNGQTYSIDQITIRKQGTTASPFHLGAYSGFDTATGALTGFLGVSNAITAAEASTFDNTLTFNFTGVNVTVDNNIGTIGAGSGLVYFFYQPSTTALASASGATTVTTHRINNADGTFANSLSGLIVGTGASGTGAAAPFTVRTDRVTEYGATITPIPEPTSAALLGLGGLALLRRRRA